MSAYGRLATKSNRRLRALQGLLSERELTYNMSEPDRLLSTQSGHTWNTYYHEILLFPDDDIMTEKELFKYWTYFKIIEKDFLDLSEFIEISENHFDVYSRELIKLLVVTCSEVDAIFRVLREIKDPGSGDGDLSIEDHFKFLEENHKYLFDESIDISPSGVSLKPFESWTKGKAPTWWTGYNKVKHHRSSDFKSANLRHCLNAGAALTLLLLAAQTEISDHHDKHLPMDPDIRLEFFGIEFNYDVAVSSSARKLNRPEKDKKK